MPSVSLQRWHNDRLPRLVAIHWQCHHCLAAVPANPQLADENLRGYVVLLSAHFQAFCRELYTECAQIIASKVRPSLQLLIQTQFSANRSLNHGNPNTENIAKDFNRFGLDINKELDADPANTLRRQYLATLNKWRNVAAHQSTPTPAAGPLSLPLLQTWRGACDGLAISIEAIMYNQLRRTLRRAPWVP